MIKKMNLFQTNEIEIIDVINDFLFCLLNVVGSDFNYKKEVYNIYTLDFDGSAIETMLADKLNAIKDRTIFRRAKDIYDIYLISTMKKILFGGIGGYYREKERS